MYDSDLNFFWEVFHFTRLEVWAHLATLAVYIHSPKYFNDLFHIPYRMNVLQFAQQERDGGIFVPTHTRSMHWSNKSIPLHAEVLKVIVTYLLSTLYSLTW
jgi:hypothetical protein